MLRHEMVPKTHDMAVIDNESIRGCGTHKKAGVVCTVVHGASSPHKSLAFIGTQMPMAFVKRATASPKQVPTAFPILARFHPHQRVRQTTSTWKQLTNGEKPIKGLKIGELNGIAKAFGGSEDWDSAVQVFGSPSSEWRASLPELNFQR